MNEQQMLAVVTARHDQDEAAGRDWFFSLPPAQRIELWTFLNQPFDDPLEEAMSRMAILQFERFVLELAAKKRAEG